MKGNSVRVELSISDHYLITKHLFRSFVICASFSAILNVMGVLTQVLDIIFEVQRKMSNENITRKKKAFQVTKCVFFLFFRLLYFQSL